MSLRFLSLFSGIEAASAAWGPLGWTCAGVSEIDSFGRAALAHHHPGVPNLGDVTLITEAQIAALGHIDVLVFGSPCQDLSVAGKRKGFDGERSSLFFVAMRIVQWARVHCGLRWAVWENVPGAFSSNDGRDFAAVVGEMAGMDTHPDVPPKGWGREGAAVGAAGLVEWSTLDAQWFGVAQRRRRVFAVADFGDWAARPPVLLESESLRGDSAPRRGTGEDIAADPAAGANGGRGATVVIEDPVVGSLCANHKSAGFNGQAVYNNQVLACVSNAEGSLGLPFLTASNIGKQFNNQQPLLVFGFNARQDPDSWLDRAGPLDTFSNTQAVAAFAFKASHFTRDKDGAPSPVAPPLSADADKGDQDTLVCAPTATYEVRFAEWLVRRLTPLECERLQAFPDNHTAIPYGGKPAADTPRYKALGNSMCVLVMRWLGKSIEFAHTF